MEAGELAGMAVPWTVTTLGEAWLCWRQEENPLPYWVMSAGWPIKKPVE